MHLKQIMARGRGRHVKEVQAHIVPAAGGHWQGIQKPGRRTVLSLHPLADRARANKVPTFDAIFGHQTMRRAKVIIFLRQNARPEGSRAV